MSVYLGTDIVYIPRIEAALNRFGERFLKRVYTLREQQDCLEALANRPAGLGNLKGSSSQRLAGRWAAKEAVAKALGTGWTGLRYTDIEIQRQLGGAPLVCLYGGAAQVASTWGECRWQLSISHDRDYCVATVIAVCV